MSHRKIVIIQCDVRHWIDKFSREYWKILLDSRWIKEAQTVYMVNQKISTIFEDEMDEIIEKYQYLFEKGEKYFVRGEGCSLKYGKHGIGTLFQYASDFGISHQFSVDPTQF